MIDRSLPVSPADMIRQRLDLTIVTRSRVVLIGLGGIGLWLTRAVVTFLAGLRAPLHDCKAIHVLLVDGDAYGSENTYRMDVPDFGNKAAVLGGQILDNLTCSGLHVRWCEEFATEANVKRLVTEGDCVLLACDNHATRKLVSDRCSQLNDVVLISGGNDGVEAGSPGTYGNVQVYVRQGGDALSAALDEYHPEIAKPADTSPAEQSCLQWAVGGAPQLSFVNLAVASAICNALLRLLTKTVPEPIYDEVALDILEGVMTPHWFR